MNIDVHVVRYVVVEEGIPAINVDSRGLHVVLKLGQPQTPAVTREYDTSGQDVGKSLRTKKLPPPPPNSVSICQNILCNFFFG